MKYGFHGIRDGRGPQAASPSQSLLSSSRRLRFWWSQASHSESKRMAGKRHLWSVDCTGIFVHVGREKWWWDQNPRTWPCPLVFNNDRKFPHERCGLNDGKINQLKLLKGWIFQRTCRLIRKVSGIYKIMASSGVRSECHVWSNGDLMGIWWDM